VDKIELEKHGNAFKATGVKVISNGGSREVYTARKEIVISGGAYCTPPILLRSGIGAKEEVEKHGIKSVIGLPGVGKNLQDHLIATAFYEVSEPKLTTDHLIFHHADAPAQAMQLWMTSQTGFLSSAPWGTFAYTRLDNRLADSSLWKDAPREQGCDPMGLTPQQPNIEFMNTECYIGPANCTDFPVNGQSAFAIMTELFAPRSRGTVQLKSADPTVNPVVHHNYLSDPLDLLVLAEGCRLGNEIVMKGSGTKGVVKGAWPEGATYHEYTEREQWKGFVKENSSTCKSNFA
jgi:choline dehydrogenase-like flavoprotein